MLESPTAAREDCLPRCELTSALQSWLIDYGSGCMAYSTLQPGLSYFCRDRVGYIAYLDVRRSVLSPRGRRIVLSDPICAQDAQEQLLREFLGKPQPTVFLQVGQSTADILRGLGLEVAQLGVEAEIDLEEFEFELRGNRYEALRRLCKRAEGEGVKVVEQEMDDTEEVKGVSRRWLQRKGGREYTLLTRPLFYEPEEDVRCFRGYRGSTLMGFIIFDPMWCNAKRVGYYQNHVRYRPDAPRGTGDLITIRAMRVFRSEGVSSLSLGLSPRWGMSDMDFLEKRRHTQLEDVLLALRLKGDFFYSFRGNEQSKRRYRPLTKDAFVGTTEAGDTMEMFAVVRAMRQFSFRHLLRWAGVVNRYSRLRLRGRWRAV